MSDKPVEDMTSQDDDVDKEIAEGLAKMATEEAEQPEVDDAASQQTEEQQTKEEPAEKPEEKQQPDSVPLNVALDWKRQAKEQARELAELKGQMNDLLSTVKQATTGKEEVPSLEDEPVAHLAHQNKVVREQIEDLRKSLEQATQRNEVQTMQHEITNIEQSFASKQEDYWEATKFLTEKRLNELQNVFGMTEEEASQRFSEETARFIQASTARGESFAEKAYEMAKASGFKSAASAKAANGAADDDAKKGKESLKKIAQKQQQSKTLAAAGGTTPKDELTAADANELSDEEFDKQFVGEEGTKRLKEIFG